MVQKLVQLKKDYYEYLDRKAKYVADKLSKSQPVTNLILDYTKELYNSAKIEIDNFNNKKFESAYHNPISSELEFLIARILYHYSNSNKLNWKIYLRRQINKATPGIGIESNIKTLAIIEIKAKAGWIQPLFSKKRYQKDKKKLKEGRSSFNPEELINKTKTRLKKYCQTYNIEPKQIFVILPSLERVHRKTLTEKLEDYEKWFAKSSELPKENFILLSKNLNLDLSSNPKRKEYKPTKRFERLISLLSRIK